MKNRKWKKICMLVLFLMIAAVPAVSIMTPVTAEAAVKTGLKKEKGKYYYYVKGKKVKNTWKTVKAKTNGKSVSYRYYFGKDGAAYMGKKVYGVKTPVIKKIKGKTYGFDTSARMVKGIYYVYGKNITSGKFYVFHSKTGAYDAAKSKKLQSVSTEGMDVTELQKLLGVPKKTSVFEGSCYGDGDDVLFYYDHCVINAICDSSGVTKIVGIDAK